MYNVTRGPELSLLPFIIIWQLCDCHGRTPPQSSLQQGRSSKDVTLSSNINSFFKLKPKNTRPKPYILKIESTTYLWVKIFYDNLRKHKNPKTWIFAASPFTPQLPPPVCCLRTSIFKFQRGNIFSANIKLKRATNWKAESIEWKFDQLSPAESYCYVTAEGLGLVAVC